MQSLKFRPILNSLSWLPEALLLIALIFLAIHFFQLTMPFAFHGSFEEQVLEYLGASNFVDYGFFKNLGIVDYGISDQNSHTAMLYTHMPSFPTLLLALLLKLGLPLLTIRLIFFVPTLLGLICLYLTLTRLDLPRLMSVILIGLLALSYQGFWLWTDHFVHSWFWLGYFGFALAMVLTLQKDKRGPPLAGATLALCCVTNFISVLACIFLFVLIQILNRGRNLRLGGWLLLILSGYLTLHILRNALVLGPAAALTELYYTIGNRIYGHPTRSEVMSFFRQNHIIWWGAEKFNPSILTNWSEQIWRQAVPYLKWASFLILGLALTDLKSLPNFLRRGALVFAIGLAPLGWYLIFLAHGQNYILPFVQNIFILMTLAFACSLGTTFAKRRPQSKTLQITKTLIIIWAFIVLFKSVYRFRVQPEWHELSETYRMGFKQSIVVSLEALRSQNIDGPVFTNLNPIVARFYIHQNLIGSCSSAGLLDLNPEQCFVNLSPGFNFSNRSDAFVLSSRELLSSDIHCQPQPKCLEELDQKLERKLATIAKTPYWTLYKVKGN